MIPDVPPTEASKEVPFLASAVEWLGPLDPGDPDVAGETPSEAGPVSEAPDSPSATTIEVVDAGTAERAAELVTTSESVDPQAQPETSPDMVAAAVAVAAATAAEIANSGDAALNAAARLNPERATSLLAQA